jgi:hypothetical protein
MGLAKFETTGDIQHLADAFRTGSFPTSGGETPFLSSTVMKSAVK